MFGLCKECDQYLDVVRLPDGPDFCPECRSIDSIDFDAPDPDEDDSGSRTSEQSN